MTAFEGFPRDGYAYSAADVGEALAGLIRRDSNGLPIPGMLSRPGVEAVPTAWKVELLPFTFIAVSGASVVFTGLSAAEQVDITTAVGIPAGQGRIDVVAWDAGSDELVVVDGAVSASPATPDIGGLEPVATVRVNSGDGAVIQSQITVVAAVTGLASAVAQAGVVPAAHVGGGQTIVTTVTFPTPFTSTPSVVVGVVADAAEGLNASVSDVDETGFRLRRSVGSIRPKGYAVGASWQAMQL